MNVLQLVLTLAVVAGGLFVYDTFLADHPVPTPPEVARTEPTTAPPPRDEPAMRVELQGAGVEGLVRRIAELEERLDEIAAAPSAVPAPRPTPGEGGAATPSSFRPADLVDGADPTFDERDLAWFRAMKDEVDRRQRQERFEEMVGNQIDRSGVTLTADQRSGVLEATMKYRASIRAAYREEGFSQKPPEEREQALQLLRAEYEQTLYTLVPASEADTLLQQMGRFPGMSGRQFGPSRPR